MNISLAKPVDKGFIYVASCKKIYYELAIESAKSLKDFYPDANVTLFTHDAWVDDRALQIFDNVITGIPVHKRAKMWCMARTPYSQTFYNDVDSLIVHKDIRTVFDTLKNGDMYMCGHVWHSASNSEYSFIDLEQTIPVQYHGAVCWYNKTKLTLDFLQNWFDEYIKQIEEPWPHGAWASSKWRGFDMFTLWKMTCGKYKEFEQFNNLVNCGDKRFNATIHDGTDYYNETKLPYVNMQIDREAYKTFANYTGIQENIDDERALPKQPATSKDTIWFN
jgi:hypothetical protein